MKNTHKLYLPKNPQHPEQKKWIQLLEKFAEMLDEYYDPRDPDDVAYWYGEQCLTGLLASAAWSLRSRKGWALVEILETGKKRKERQVDMWLGIDKDKKASFTVEAKSHPPTGGDPGKSVQSISTEIMAALEQLKKIPKKNNYRWGLPAAVCYIVPALPTSPRRAPPSEIDRMFSESPLNILGDLTKRFPRARIVIGSFRFRGKPPKDKGWCYPGIIVVVVIWTTWRSLNIPQGRQAN